MKPHRFSPFGPRTMSLLYEGGMSCAEIAQVVNRCANTVRARLHEIHGKPLRRVGGKAHHDRQRRQRIVEAVKAKVWSEWQAEQATENIDANTNIHYST